MVNPKSLAVLLALGVSLLAGAACSQINYQGTTLPALPADTPVAFYYDAAQIPPPYRVLGDATYLAPSGQPRADLRAKLADCARSHGADAIQILSMTPIREGEARADQINNTAAPSWTVADNSATSLTYLKDSLFYSGKDPDRSVYRILVKAYFLLLEGNGRAAPAE